MTVATLRPDEHCAWKSESLLIVDRHGECGDDTPLGGFYYRETRYLRTLRLRINGRPPWLCHVTAAAPDHLLFDYTHPELTNFGGGGSGQADDAVTPDEAGIPHRALDLRATYVVGLATLRVDLVLTNRSRQEVELELGWFLSADFADLTEALAEARQVEARVGADLLPNGLEFSWEHPELPYRTRCVASGPGDWRRSPARLASLVRLRPQEPAQFLLTVDAVDYLQPLAPADIERRERALEQWRAGLTRFTMAENLGADAVLRDQIRDFASFPLLDGAPDEWLAPQAGVPLYPALFGRDAITAGWQAAPLDRGMQLDATLTRVGRLQGRTYDLWRDEQPGRIIQQVRQGPLARLHRTPHGRYYGDFASPLMFVIGLAHLYAWDGRRATLARHWDTARRIMEWAATDGDPDRDGYLEYLTRSPDGAKHQGWKDSGDAVVYEDGRPVPTPVGTCELQGYWFVAQQLMAVLSWITGAREDARAFWRSAAELKERFNRDWWIAADASLALALDPDKRPIHAPSSNMGQCLATGLVTDAHMPALVGRLFAPDLFSGWGIRTLSSDHRSHNPIGYHLGSGWPVENATIVFGLRRFGFEVRALELARALFDLATLYPGTRVPECVGGYARGDWPSPGAYPRANPLQLWNTSGYVMLMQAILGLQPVAPLDLLVVDPALPTWLPEVVVHDLRLAGAMASLRFWRDARGHSHVEVLHRRGTLHVLKQPPPEALGVPVTDRFRALVDRLVPA
ncbi:MAG: glycogen debranching N-terminal domain-containing protein [Gemmatimonadales bacterium]